MIIKNPNYSNEYYGMSTDTKPTDALNASRFYEIDTSDVYMFDEEGKQWFKQNSGVSDDGTSGGSNNSGNGTLMINITTNGRTRIMDKTWQEIHDANFAFAKEDRYVQEMGTTVTYVCPVVLTTVANGDYVVGISTYETGEGTATLSQYIAESADDYPKQGGSV